MVSSIIEHTFFSPSDGHIIVFSSMRHTRSYISDSETLSAASNKLGFIKLVSAAYPVQQQQQQQQQMLSLISDF
jgi:hypothetical protein